MDVVLRAAHSVKGGAWGLGWGSGSLSQLLTFRMEDSFKVLLKETPLFADGTESLFPTGVDSQVLRANRQETLTCCS